MKILKTPPVKWERAVKKMGIDERMKLCDEAAAIATRAARVNAYISRFLSGGKHADAVKAQNRAARRVRQALGYTYADDSITF